MASSALSCIPTVQSYDDFSILASDCRPGVALFPTCRAVRLPHRMCARSHAYRRERGTLAFPWVWRGCKAPPFCYPTGKILLPSWAAIFLQLGSSAPLFYALSVPCVPRSVDAIWGVRLLFYLLINRSYIPIPSLHRARNELVFINAKFHCCNYSAIRL